MERSANEATNVFAKETVDKNVLTILKTEDIYVFIYMRL